MSFALKISRFAMFLGLLTTTVFAAAQANDVVVQINGEKVTRQQLEEQESTTMLQARYDFYKAQQKALDGMINRRLVEAEAKKKNLTVDELFKHEIDDKIKDLSDEQLHFVYEVAGLSEPFDAIKSKLQESVRQQRAKKMRGEYITALREKADVVILLAPPRADFDTTEAARLGPANAPIQLVEFADYECPYCIKVHPELKKLKDEFGDKVALVYMDMPLPMHANAQKAAEAARCARTQNKFWEYHDRLFSAKQIDVASLKQMAGDLGLDTAKFNTCLDSSQAAAAVKKDADEAQKIGLQATPSFFLNGKFFTGALPYEELRKMVLRELGDSNKTAKNVAEKGVAKAE